MATNNAVNLNQSGIVTYDAAGSFTAITSPLSVSNGGQGNATLAVNGVICGGTTSTNPLQVVSTASANRVLISNGAGALPSWAIASQGYTFTLQTLTGNPLDGLTYFLGQGLALTSRTSNGAGNTRFYFPLAGTITACYGAFSVAGTLGSSENATVAIRLNNTTNTNVTTALQLTSATVGFTNSALTITVAVGDYIEFLLINPTYLTNPTTVLASMSIIVQ